MKRYEINGNPTDSLAGLAIIQIVNEIDAFLRGLQSRIFFTSILLPKPNYAANEGFRSWNYIILDSSFHRIPIFSSMNYFVEGCDPSKPKGLHEFQIFIMDFFRLALDAWMEKIV